MDIDPTGTDQQQTEPPVTQPRRLYRSSDQKIFLGVAGGLGEYFDLDPTLVRILFVAGLLVGLASIPVYLVLAMVMPDEDSLDLEPRVAAKRTLDQAGSEIERGVNLAVDKVRTTFASRGTQPATSTWSPPPPSSADAPTVRIDTAPDAPEPESPPRDVPGE